MGYSQFRHNPLCNHVTVILVEPGNSLNIGAVARAMLNLGFNNLRLVAPPRYDREIANTTACWATSVLDQAVIFDSLEEALIGMQDVVGFSARVGKNRGEPELLGSFCSNFLEAKTRSTAFLFGPEDTGLTHEHTSHCRKLIAIPSAEENPSYNLAQAVLLALYELSRSQIQPHEPVEQILPDWELFSQLDYLVDEALSLSGFYNQGTPNQLPELIQNFWRRMEPNQREMQVLLGMFSRMKKALSGEVPIQTKGGHVD